jgi:hypothetical protein
MEQPLINTSPEGQLIFPVEQIITMLIKDQKINEGLFSLGIQFQIALGGVGIDPKQIYPGAMIGVSGIGLAKALQPGQNVVDAAVVNPKKTKK